VRQGTGKGCRNSSGMRMDRDTAMDLDEVATTRAGSVSQELS
jgi:hypothetical protein